MWNDTKGCLFLWTICCVLAVLSLHLFGGFL